MIEKLDQDSKNMLNSLVQSVIATQQANEKDKLEILAAKRKLINAQKVLEQERLDFTKQKGKLQQMQRKNEII